MFRRKRQRQIDPAFARVLASQVAVGLMRSGGPSEVPTPEAQRSRSCLMVIGLMLMNACPDDDVVAASLDLAERATVHEVPGGIELHSTPPDGTA